MKLVADKLTVYTHIIIKHLVVGSPKTLCLNTNNENQQLYWRCSYSQHQNRCRRLSLSLTQVVVSYPANPKQGNTAH